MKGTNEDPRESLKVIFSKIPEHLLLSMYHMMGKKLLFLGFFFLQVHILVFWQFKLIDSFRHLKRSF